MQNEHKQLALLCLIVSCGGEGPSVDTSARALEEAFLLALNNGTHNPSSWAASGSAPCTSTNKWACVDETPPSSMDLVTSSTNNARQTFTLDLSSMANGSSITEICPYITAARNSAGGKIKPTFRLNGVDTTLASLTLSTSFVSLESCMILSPPVTKTAFTTLEVGAVCDNCGLVFPSTHTVLVSRVAAKVRFQPLPAAPTSFSVRIRPTNASANFDYEYMQDVWVRWAWSGNYATHFELQMHQSGSCAETSGWETTPALSSIPIAASVEGWIDNDGIVLPPDNPSGGPWTPHGEQETFAYRVRTVGPAGGSAWVCATKQGLDRQHPNGIYLVAGADCEVSIYRCSPLSDCDTTSAWHVYFGADGMSYYHANPVGGNANPITALPSAGSWYTWRGSGCQPAGPYQSGGYGRMKVCSMRANNGVLGDSDDDEGACVAGFY